MSLSRLKFLDGMRGIAIISVVLFHSYHFWNHKELFKQNQILSNLFSKGSLGVELFFMISGFVIFMTLEKTDSIKMFIWKRWLRLMPLIILVGLLIYFTSPLLPYRPQGPVEAGSLLPSLTLIPQGLLGSFFQFPYYEFTDAALWSLVAEVFFYFLAALFFYIFKDRRLIGLTLLYISYFMTVQILTLIGLEKIKENLVLVYIIEIVIFLDNYYFYKFGWFLIGIYIYRYFKLKQAKNEVSNSLIDKSKTQLYLVPIMLVILMFLNKEIDSKNIMWYPIVLLVFLAAFFVPIISKMFTSKILIYIGLISYPLYLFHTNLIVALSNQLSVWFQVIPVELLPITPILLSIVIAHYLEKADKLIKPYITKVAQKIKIIN